MFLPRARLEAIRSPLEIWSAEMHSTGFPGSPKHLQRRPLSVLHGQQEDVCRTIVLKPKRRRKGSGRGRPDPYLPQHFLYFLPLPHGQGSFRPILGGAT